VLATSYGLDDRGIGVRVPVKSDFLHVVQTGSGAYSAFYLTGSRGGVLSPGATQPGREADHSPPTSAEVKETWI
jgi:hypothetical protein